MIYRVVCGSRLDDGRPTRVEFHATQRGADAAHEEWMRQSQMHWAGVDRAKTPRNKQEIVRLLERWATR